MEKRTSSCKRPTVWCPDCNKALSNANSLWRLRKICSGSGVSSVQKSVEDQSDENNPRSEPDSVTDSESDEDSSEEEIPKTPPVVGDVSNTFVWKTNENTQKNHSFLLPRDIRGVIVGKSGFGKTTLLNYMLLEPDVLDYNNLIVCGNSLHQPEYKIMNAAFAKKLSKKQIKFLFEHQEQAMDEGGPEKVIEKVERPRGDINAEFYTDVGKIPDPADHDPT